jgi:hypothetical protein
MIAWRNRSKITEARSNDMWLAWTPMLYDDGSRVDLLTPVHDICISRRRKRSTHISLQLFGNTA